MTAVSAGIAVELHHLAAALLYGAGAAAVYDLLRVFRRILPRGVVCVSLEDVLYWAVVCMGTFAFFVLVNSGQIRAYLAGGIASGALLYHWLIGKWIVEGVSKLVRLVKKELKKHGKAVTIKWKRR